MTTHASNTYLITGATGLVGSHILAELLSSDSQVAVLVRGSGRATSEQRIDEVLTHFESKFWLPRPRILVGDLNSPDLNLSKADQEWLRNRRLVIVHSAASIRFQRDERTGEPYRSNVDGTRHLVNFCRHLNVIHFHHVSTAYVGCRTSSGTVNEEPVNDVAEGGNDYERSKIAAEQLILNAAWLHQKTIHRPSIVVGDSKTGFTSTFNGFYSPLQIGAQFAKAFGFKREAGDWFRQQIGIRETDSKNLVTVDWLSNAIAGIIRAETNESVRIFHWTNPSPVSCRLIQSAILDTLERKFGGISHTSSDRLAEFSHAESFSEQMRAYESYFNNDPIFDTSRSRREKVQHSCPTVTYALLVRLAEYALEVNFGWPKPPLKDISFPVVRDILGVTLEQSALHRNLVIEKLTASSGNRRAIELQLTGPGAVPRISFFNVDGRWFGYWSDSLPDLTECIRLTASTEALAESLIDINVLVGCIRTGKLVIHGSLPTEYLAIVADWAKYMSSARQNFTPRTHD